MKLECNDNSCQTVTSLKHSSIYFELSSSLAQAQLERNIDCNESHRFALGTANSEAEANRSARNATARLVDAQSRLEAEAAVLRRDQSRTLVEKRALERQLKRIKEEHEKEKATMSKEIATLKQERNLLLAQAREHDVASGRLVSGGGGGGGDGGGGAAAAAAADADASVKDAKVTAVRPFGGAEEGLIYADGMGDGSPGSVLDRLENLAAITDSLLSSDESDGE